MAPVDDVDKLIERFHLARAEIVRGHLQREGGSAVVRRHLIAVVGAFVMGCTVLLHHTHPERRLKMADAKGRGPSTPPR